MIHLGPGPVRDALIERRNSMFLNGWKKILMTAVGILFVQFFPNGIVIDLATVTLVMTYIFGQSFVDGKKVDAAAKVEQAQIAAK